MSRFTTKLLHTTAVKRFTQLYTPKTSTQQLYSEYLNKNTNSIIVSTGPAGTGKTLFACTTAIEQLKKQNIDKIILTRPVVPVEEDIGFLPGNIKSKMDPWVRPIMDIFTEFYSKNELEKMLYNGKIEISPLGYMRGRTFKNAFIIADEMQNSSPNQMFMLLTRIGINSRMVITGDLAQSDKQKHNGLSDFINKYKNNVLNDNTNVIKLVELQAVDIQRSEIVEKIVKLYDTNREPSHSCGTDDEADGRVELENIFIDDFLKNANNCANVA